MTYVDDGARRAREMREARERQKQFERDRRKARNASRRRDAICMRCGHRCGEHEDKIRCPDGSGREFKRHVACPTRISTSFSAAEVELLDSILRSYNGAPAMKGLCERVASMRKRLARQRRED